jgi:hypothetical protein
VALAVSNPGWREDLNNGTELEGAALVNKNEMTGAGLRSITLSPPNMKFTPPE